MRFRYLLLALILASPLVGHAQRTGAPRRATVTPIAESDGVRPGSSVKVALKVSLEDGYHSQANKPKDPNLIPTELTPETPPGVTVSEIVFPEPSQLKQENVPEPLLVFEHEFTIGVVLDVGRDVPAGEINVPASLHYQACNDKMCFFPVTIPTSWTLNVVGAGAPIKPLNTAEIGRVAWGHGEKPIRLKPDPTSGGSPTGAGSPANTATAAGAGAASSENVATTIARLDSFTLAQATTGYLGSEEFVQFIRDAEAGKRQAGMFEGRGPLAILLIVFLGGLALNLTPCVLPMIPINLAIIGAGSQAGSRSRGFALGTAYGAAMAFV